MSELTIDYRLKNNSGIGRYLRSVVPFLIKRKCSAVKINLLAGENEFGGDLAVKTYKTISSIYSLYEQIEIPKVVSANTTLLWVPHYNIPLFYRGPLLVTVHDLAHLALSDLFNGLHKQAYAKTMFTALKYKADKIICVSEFTKQELIKFIGVKEDKVEVIYNGIEDQWFNIEKGKKPETSPYLLFVGNIKPHKNLKTLIKAFLAIRDRIPHNLVLVGKKSGFITGDHQIDNLITKAPERIKFTGYISDEELRQYYIHADLFVFPSLYEGFGYPPIEAMASGCPVIASNVASIPEICGNAVEYFNPSNVDELISKIEDVVFDESKKQKLSVAGRKQAKSYSLQKVATKTTKIIEEML